MTTSLEPVAEDWLTSIESRSRFTAASYRQSLKRFYAVVRKPVADITARDVSAFVADLNSSQLAPGSRAAYMSGVRSFLHHCQEEEILPKSPMHLLKRPRVEITSMNRYIEPEEARAFVAAASERDRLAVALMLATGVRVGEVIGAQWRHLFKDAAGRLGLLVHGKGGKSRVVAVPDALWAIIAADRAQRHLDVDLDDRDASPLVATRDGRPYSRSGLLKLVHRVAGRTGIRKRVSPHWLRHTYGTLAALAGIQPYQLQRDMGHSRLETSQRYIHWTRGLQGAGAFAVADALFGKE